MTEITHEASEEFARKVKELLETKIGKPYSIARKIQLDESLWGVYLDEDKLSLKERFSLNEGAWWVGEKRDGTVFIYSWRFYNLNDVALNEYNLHLQIDDDLLERKNWEKYREKVPGLIIELEAAERIANEMNVKYGSNIKLWAGQKPCFETSFDAREMSEDEKLHEIEEHARAMYESWGSWREWTGRAGNDIYAKTSGRHLRKYEYVDMVLSSLRNITEAHYNDSYVGRVRVKRGTGTVWVVVGDSGDERNISANRGVWYIKETRDSIMMMSDNLETINARNLEEYVMIQRRRTGKVGVLGVKSEFKETIISLELVQRVIGQVGEKFKVKMEVREDEPMLMTTFQTTGLGPYGKLHEIEKHAKALAEAWNGMRGI